MVGGDGFIIFAFGGCGFIEAINIYFN